MKERKMVGFEGHNRWQQAQSAKSLRDRTSFIPNDGTVLDKLLYEILCVPTPHGHEKDLYAYLPDVSDKIIDDKGNVIIKVGKHLVDYKTLFSCHLDTMHTDREVDKLFNLHSVTSGPADDQGKIFACSWNEKKKEYEEEVLGADDKLGVFICIKMIEANIPGLYVFHVGEERGGVGSEYIKKNTPELLKGLNRAIAFDRMNYTDIIDWQRGGNCCSKKFGEALAEALNSELKLPALKYKSGIIGSFTDTANYRELIPECTNISVGYFNQHSKQEHFDEFFLQHQLLPAILKVKWEELPTDRDHTKATNIVHYTSHKHTTTVVHETKKTRESKKFILRTVTKGEDGSDVVTYKVIDRLYNVGYIWNPNKGLDPSVDTSTLTKGIIKWIEGASNAEVTEALVKSYNSNSFGFTSSMVDWGKQLIPRADIMLRFNKIYNEMESSGDIAQLPKFIGKNFLAVQKATEDLAECIMADDVEAVDLSVFDDAIAQISLCLLILSAYLKGEMFKKYEASLELLIKDTNDYVIDVYGG